MSGISRAAFSDAKQKASAALQNEQVTRIRVEHLEQRISVVDAILARSFLGRLRWLLLGR